MNKAGIYAISVLGSLFTAPLIQAQDLSRYREFQFGMSLPAVAKQVRLKTSDAKVLHRRPAVIQELTWEALSFTHSSPRPESVKDVLFSFYNGELFRIVVNYDREQTEGLTAEDIMEVLSSKYGTASKPSAEITIFSTQIYSDGERTYSNQSEKVIARWENEQYAFNLFQSSTQSAFSLVAYSKRLDAQAQAAAVEAIRLDRQEAPQKEIERRNKKDNDNRAQQENARRKNKPPFRP